MGDCTCRPLPQTQDYISAHSVGCGVHVWRTRRPDLAGLYIQAYTAIRVRFSWDARKSDRNLRERGFDFEFATQVFDGATLEREDSRRDYGERRVIALGFAQDVLLTVVYADRAEKGGEINRRIISARKSSRREREAYKEAASAEQSGPARSG